MTTLSDGDGRTFHALTQGGIYVGHDIREEGLPELCAQAEGGSSSHLGREEGTWGVFWRNKKADPGQNLKKSQTTMNTH